MNTGVRDLQRLRYVPGQDLLSRDFRDQESFDTVLREWHVRAMHGAFGVSFGLKVDVVTIAGPPLAFKAAVAPGLAYDAAGRALLLQDTRTLRVPQTWPQTPLLVIRARGGGVVELTFASEERLQPCDVVPIAKLKAGVVGPMPDPNFHPPSARPLARPQIGFGSTLLGGTAWQAELLPNTTAPEVLSLKILVDTRAASFTRLPCYFAWLQGRVPPFDISPSVRGVRLALHPSVEEEKHVSFLFRVLTVPPIRSETVRRQVLALAQEHLALCWLGIEGHSEAQSSAEVRNGHS